MKTKSASQSSAVFVRVAQNLYRYKTGTYYAWAKKAGRLIHRSLDTKDRKLAERRLADFKTRTRDLANGPDANASFTALARHWLDLNRHAMSAGTAHRKTQYIAISARLIASDGSCNEAHTFRLPGSITNSV